MEDPATWGQAERIIHDVLERFWTERERWHRSEHGAPASVVAASFSLERQIADALRDAGQIGTGTPPDHYEDLAKRFSS
jgi:hypothetical protein